MLIEWPHIQTALMILLPFGLWALTAKNKLDMMTELDKRDETLSKAASAQAIRMREEFAAAYASTNSIVTMEIAVEKRFNSVDIRFNELETQITHLAKREDLIVIQGDLKYVVESLQILRKKYNE